jgi:hypothetical protein
MGDLGECFPSLHPFHCFDMWGRVPGMALRRLRQICNESQGEAVFFHGVIKGSRALEQWQTFAHDFGAFSLVWLCPLQEVQPIHLLWKLLFLKMCAAESVLRCLCECDEMTL